MVHLELQFDKRPDVLAESECKTRQVVSCRGCAFSTHEAPNELRNFVRRGIEREMASVDDVHFGLWDIAAISFRLRGVEREFVLTPDHQ